MNYSQNNLNKLEQLIKENEYLIRYEKGTFNSGYCILQDRKIVIINKYFTQDVKFQKLIDILDIIEIDKEKLSEVSLRFYSKYFQNKTNKSTEIKLHD